MTGEALPYPNCDSESFSALVRLETARTPSAAQEASEQLLRAAYDYAIDDILLADNYESTEDNRRLALQITFRALSNLLDGNDGRTFVAHVLPGVRSLDPSPHTPAATSDKDSFDQDQPIIKDLFYRYFPGRVIECDFQPSDQAFLQELSDDLDGDVVHAETAGEENAAEPERLSDETEPEPELGRVEADNLDDLVDVMGQESEKVIKHYYETSRTARNDIMIGRQDAALKINSSSKKAKQYLSELNTLLNQGEIGEAYVQLAEFDVDEHISDSYVAIIEAKALGIATRRINDAISYQDVSAAIELLQDSIVDAGPVSFIKAVEHRILAKALEFAKWGEFKEAGQCLDYVSGVETKERMSLVLDNEVLIQAIGRRDKSFAETMKFVQENASPGRAKLMMRLLASIS